MLSSSLHNYSDDGAKVCIILEKICIKPKFFCIKVIFPPFGMADLGGRGIGTETAGAVIKGVALCAHTSKVVFSFIKRGSSFRKDEFFFS